MPSLGVELRGLVLHAYSTSRVLLQQVDDLTGISNTLTALRHARCWITAFSSNGSANKSRPASVRDIREESKPAVTLLQISYSSQ